MNPPELSNHCVLQALLSNVPCTVCSDHRLLQGWRQLLRVLLGDLHHKWFHRLIPNVVVSAAYILVGDDLKLCLQGRWIPWSSFYMNMEPCRVGSLL